MTTSLIVAALMGNLRHPSQDAQLDLAIPGATLASVSQQIGTQLGARVILDPSVANDLVVIWVKSKPASQVMQKIGEATATKWTLTDGVLTVSSDSAVRSQEFAKVRAQNAKDILESKRTFLENLKPQKYKDDDGEEYEYEPATEQYLIGDLLRNVPDQTLTSIQPGQRLVLSSRPTPMQRPLGRFDSKRVMDWIAENNAQFEGTEGAEDYQNDPEYQQYIQMFGQEMLEMMPKPIKEQPQKLLLILERDNESEFEEVSIHVQVRVQGASTLTLLSTDTWLGSQSEGEVFAEAVDQQTVSAPARAAGTQDHEEPRKPMPGDDIKIEFSKDALLLRAAWGDSDSQTGMPSMPKVSGRVKELLADPVTYEPMRYEIGEVLMQAAEKRGLPLVAPMIDEIDIYERDMPKTLGDLRDELPWYEMEEAEKDGWWQFSLTDPAPNWAKRMDRQALAALLQESAKKTFVSLDNLATFIYRFPAANQNTVANSRLKIVAPQLMSSFGGGNELDMMRLYGSMSPGERQRLKQSGSITIGALSSNTQSELSRQIFGAGGSLMPVDPQKDLADQDIVKMVSGSFGMGMGMGYGYAGHEPTEALPNGLPRNGVLGAKVDTDNYLVAMGPEGGLVSGLPPLGRAELAMLALMMKNPEFLAQMDQYGEMLRFLRTGRRETIRLAALVAPKLGIKGSLQDLKEPDMANAYTLTNLPGPLKTQVEADLQTLQNSPLAKMLEQMGSMGSPSGPIKP